jgi:Rhodopirellula transposase DDE domain
VNVGTDHDTAAFAVESIRRWWNAAGRGDYPAARRLLITADAGGSNGYRARAWKTGLAALAAETGLEITVCHFPPGTERRRAAGAGPRPKLTNADRILATVLRAFSKGASGRTKAIIKAGLAAAAILKLLSNAKKNAEADPTLCKFVPNIDTIKASLSNLASKIKGGTATSGDAESTSNLLNSSRAAPGSRRRATPRCRGWAEPTAAMSDRQHLSTPALPLVLTRPLAVLTGCARDDLG